MRHALIILSAHPRLRGVSPACSKYLIFWSTRSVDWWNLFDILLHGSVPFDNTRCRIRLTGSEFNTLAHYLLVDTRYPPSTWNADSSKYWVSDADDLQSLGHPKLLSIPEFAPQYRHTLICLCSLLSFLRIFIIFCGCTASQCCYKVCSGRFVEVTRKLYRVNYSEMTHYKLRRTIGHGRFAWDLFSVEAIHYIACEKT